MFIRLLLAFTIVPVIEIYVLLKVGGLIGALPTIGLIVATGIAGAYLARIQGFDIVRRLQTETAQGRLPAESLLDGAMVLAGGLLLLTPGFCTDLFGFCLLVPATRGILKKWLRRSLQHYIDRGQIHIHRM
jgi:UPF0716 protein FxsA